MSPVHQLSEGVVAVQFIEALSSSLTSSLEYCDCCRVGDEPNLQDNSNDNPSSIMCQQRRKSEMNGGVGDGVNQRRCSTSKDGSSVPLKRSYSSYLRLPIPSSKYYTDESMKIWKQMKMSNSYYYAWGANRARRMREKSFSKWLGPLCLPMLLVIQPLSEANMRISLSLLVLAFLCWNQYHRRYHKFFSRKAWLQGQELHCEKCDSSLLEQIEHQVKPAVSWHVRSLRRMPWRVLSRNVGHLINATTLFPLWVTWVVIWCYIRMFGCRLEEAERDSIRQYISLGDFFCRKLKPGVRPIALDSAVVSPADGTVTFSGQFKSGYLEQVKGVHYSLSYFLGLESAEGNHGSLHAASTQECLSRLLEHKDGSTALFQWVIYLSPGDYHRFHSPADWSISKRRHFPGELLSVKPNMVSAFPGLFHVNERVAWTGQWEHGFFSMTAVGATNVGSIHADFDPELRTNQAVTLKRECTMATACSRRTFHFNERVFSEPVQMKRGDEFGHFKFGSTLVLLFEAPKSFAWDKDIQKSDDLSFFKVQMGQPLATL